MNLLFVCEELLVFIIKNLNNQKDKKMKKVAFVLFLAFYALTSYALACPYKDGAAKSEQTTQN